MSYQLPPLAYSYDALEPYIDAATMEIHHTKHHAAYIAKLNKIMEGQRDLYDRPLETLIANIRLMPDEVRQDFRNNGGGHLNHSLFWRTMGPGKGGEPAGVLAHAIETDFGRYDRFKDQFSREAIARFGSGWAWLVVGSAGKLEVISTPNQDSPIMLGYRPILGLDVCEHAYYLKYQSRRAEYVAAWWNVVDWSRVAELYAHVMESTVHK